MKEMRFSEYDTPAPSYLRLVEPDMAQVDRVIAENLSSGVPLVGQVANYILQAGGKRLRPVLLLLMAGLLKFKGEARFNLAAVVEFIHTATLLHDDVVDESTLRRGRDTANQTFGNAASVLVGDFLYSRAFQMMVKAQDLRVFSTLADATNVIAEGEVLQLMNMHDARLTLEQYLRVIGAKTAKLFEAAARLGAILAGADESIEHHCAQYGAALGRAYQLVDDVLDYTGTSEEMGKNLGDDLREGKATLPLIVAMQKAAKSDAAFIAQAIEAGDVDQINTVVRIVESCGALDESMRFAQEQINQALTHLQAMTASHQRHIMTDIMIDPLYEAALLELPGALLARRS